MVLIDLSGTFSQKVKAETAFPLPPTPTMTLLQKSQLAIHSIYLELLRLLCFSSNVTLPKAGPINKSNTSLKVIKIRRGGGQ